MEANAVSPVKILKKLSIWLSLLMMYQGFI